MPGFIDPVISPNKLPVTDRGNVSYVRPDVALSRERWTRIADCLRGEDAVKAKNTTYLPLPDLDDENGINGNRYKSYIGRAVFYGVTSRTLKGLVGQVFGRDSKIDFTGQLEPLMKDASGEGVGINQQAKKTLEWVLAFGRAGILADFPKTTGPVTKLDVDEGIARPILRTYRPENIINWRTRKVGAKTALSLVVLVEMVDIEDDGFEARTATAYRVLRLNEQNEYTVAVYYEKVENGQTNLFEHQPEAVVKDATGKPFKVIPFTFVGPENNDATIDDAPLYDLTNINIAHYRNSADYEDACFIAGQPTLWAAGLTQEWADKYFKDGIKLGSRAALPLPRDGQAGLLQAAMNSMPKEAMDQKENQMVALGAKLVEERTIRRTATEAKQDEASEVSILSSSTKNVNEAYIQALEWADMFTADAPTFEFELNSDFDLSALTPNERAQLIAEWQAEAISWTEMRAGLRRTRVATQDNEEALSDIKENPPITTKEQKEMDAAEKAAEQAVKAAEQTAANQQPATGGGNQSGL